MSLVVPPIEMPSICVCTAPDAAVAQTSLLIVVTAGATAVGGGDFTVVSDFDVLFVVLLLVESVTMGSAAYVNVLKNIVTAVIVVFITIFTYIGPVDVYLIEI